MARIRIETLTKRFGPVVAVDRLSIDIADKEFVSLLGPSGCGKTTTLQMLAGFLRPDEGAIYVDEQLVSSPATMLLPEKREMGMVFQDYAVWPHKSVFQNVAFGLEVRALPRAEIARRVAEVLETVGLAGLERRYPGQLSGGQQQRVALARALVIKPRILLLDEPLSNLDARLRDKMRDELAELQRRVGITFVYVTHDQTEAMRLSDRIAVMRSGRLQQLGRPQHIYESPANAFVAEFMGAVNLLDGEVVEAGTEAATVALDNGVRVRVRAPRPLAAGAAVRLSVRPEDVRLLPSGAADAVATGRVRDRAYLGRVVSYAVALAGGEIHAEAHPETAFRIGEGVGVWFSPERCAVIPAADESPRPAKPPDAPG